MSAHAVDGAALVAAAVQAAIRERAPRRTVAAVAAAVVGTLMNTTARAPVSATLHQPRNPEPDGADEKADDPAVLLASLRSARCAQRKRKKERRRAAKAAANDASLNSMAGAADKSSDRGESTALLSAQALAAAVDIGPSQQLEEIPMEAAGGTARVPVPDGDFSMCSLSNDGKNLEPRNLAPAGSFAASIRSLSRASSLERAAKFSKGRAGGRERR